MQERQTQLITRRKHLYAFWRRQASCNRPESVCLEDGRCGVSGHTAAGTDLAICKIVPPRCD